jgi:hypothetical protein
MEKRQVEFLSIRANINAKTIDKANRTVEVVFATETPVKRGYYEPWHEVLSLKEGHVRMERIANGKAPVLDTHRSGSLGTLLGVVESARIENGLAIAKIRFSKRAEVDKIWQDVEDGIINNVSVGYDVHGYTRTKVKTETQLEELTATDWEPYEISMVPMPADHNSHVRGKEERQIEVPIIDKNSNSNKMTEAEKKAAIEAERKRVSEINRLVREANLPADFGQNLIDNDKTVDEARTAIATEVKRVKDNPPAEDVKAAERKRCAEINKVCRQAGLSVTDAEKFIEEGKTVDQVRELVIEKWAENDPTKGVRGGISVGKEDSTKKREVMEEALVLRASGGEIKVETLVARGKTAEEAKAIVGSVREYRGMTLLRMAEEVLTAANINVRGMSKREIALTALGLMGRDGGMHSTSDFSYILGNTVNRQLRAAYELAPRTFMPFCTKTTAADFRPMKKVQISGLVGAFDEVKEHGEYKAGTLTDKQEEYAVAKYGKKILLTWEAIVNDDLNAFSRIPAAIAAKAAQKQSDLVYAILTSNPKLADNVDLFHSTHGNLTSSGTAIDVTSLGKGRELIRKQKSIENDYLNLAPQFLIVAPEKEQLAYQYTSANYVANTSSAINPPTNTSLKVIVEPRLSALNSGLSWFLACAPGLIDTIEYAFLEGEGELFTEQRVGFDVDGLEIKARMVFGAAPIDHRGLYKNVGA